MSYRALPGFRDFYPDEFAERAHIFSAWRAVAARFGFQEYDGPPLEQLELYTSKSGEEIAEQLYAFTDRGGREVALRPEMTPSLARMVAARANALPRPIRWFSVPQLFRYERQQRGRLREHFQLNVDILGEPAVSADAELLAVAIEIMRELGLGPADVSARVSDRQLLQALLASIGISAAQMPAVFAVVDKLERDPRHVLEERLAAIGVGEDSHERIFEVLAVRDPGVLRRDFGDDTAVAAELDRLETYFGYLDALGVRDWVAFDLSIVRGLAYYTGIVFELFDARGELRAICGGGRYDDLLGALGGVEMPALGFGMGDVVLGELLRDRGLLDPRRPALDYWVAVGEGVPIERAMFVAAALRQRGLCAEYSLRDQKLSGQLKSAARAGAIKACILQTDRSAVVRRLRDGAEHEVDLDSMLDSTEAMHDRVRLPTEVDAHDPWVFDDEQRVPVTNG
jgi:histidyl-tRNA synthetase